MNLLLILEFAFFPLSSHCYLHSLIIDWKQLIHVAAIDCAEERNLATCVHYQIEGYPSVKVSVTH